MSQILAKPRYQKSGLIQDVILPNKRKYLTSNASIAACYVCNKGLNHGYSLVARVIGNETVLLCDTHNTKS